MTKEEYLLRLTYLRILLDARVLDLGEYTDAINKVRGEFHSQQVLKNTNLCLEIPMPREHIDDIWSYAINNRNPYYDTKSNSYKLLLKPLN